MARWFNHAGGHKYFPKPKLPQQKIIVTAWWSAIAVLHYENITGVSLMKFTVSKWKKNAHSIKENQIDTAESTRLNSTSWKSSGTCWQDDTAEAHQFVTPKFAIYLIFPLICHPLTSTLWSFLTIFKSKDTPRQRKIRNSSQRFLGVQTDRVYFLI